MQSQFNLLGDLNQRLSSMRGIEFIVHLEHPPDMWIIRKQQRNSPEDGIQAPLQLITVVIPLTYYFVVNENIYQSSDIYSIIASRMVPS
jgi:mediator of RNA polymerase II transcription subunit 6